MLTKYILDTNFDGDMIHIATRQVCLFHAEYTFKVCMSCLQSQSDQITITIGSTISLCLNIVTLLILGLSKFIKAFE